MEVNGIWNHLFNNIFGNFRNQFVHGLSDSRSWDLEANLLRGYFRFSMETRDFRVDGDYNIQGSIFSTIPIVGSGHFNYSSKLPRLDFDSIQFSDFRVVNDHIDVTTALITVAYMDVQCLKLKLDGLDAGGYEADLTELVDAEYRNSLNFWLRIRFVGYLRRYFQEVFEATPVSEIIGIGTTMSPSKFHSGATDYTLPYTTPREETYPPETDGPTRGSDHDHFTTEGYCGETHYAKSKNRLVHVS